MAKLLLLVCLCTIISTQARTRQDVRLFPDGFLFGASTASYQIEGAWDADGKSESIWDHLTHTNPSAIKENHNGDVATDSYNNIERDVRMLRELGLDFYRFSLSWTRIMPTSFPDYINEAGVAYYNNLINEMLKHNIQPMITLYHWDLPQKLQDLGGWANPHIADWFGDYVRVAFELFGDRVKYWITINEPKEVCLRGYGLGDLAPLYTMTGYGDYMCMKNLLVAHARAYHIYDEEFKANQGGVIGITMSAKWYEPETEKDTEAANDYLEFELGAYAHPIFSESGNYPQVMIDNIAANSAAEGFARSRLPELSAEEIEYIKGTSDFFGLNHYTTSYVFRNESVTDMHDVPSYMNDINVDSYQPDDWLTGTSGWHKYAPWGFHKLLTRIREAYNNPEVFITENGFPSDEYLEDHNRVYYYRGYLGALLDAIAEGCNVTMYSAWSLMDNFEWTAGYTERFGLYQVDYESPERTCTPRRSAFVYKQVIRSRALDLTYEPDTTEMTID